MTTLKTYRRSPLALAILSLLFEEPMHPYRMQQLIRGRAKDEVINVRQRASLYQTIDRLLRDGLVAVHATDVQENRPDRTTYALTAEGQRTARVWLREMLSAPAWEFPEFPAALSFLPLLDPDDAARQLENRAAAIRDDIARLDATYDDGSAMVPRLFLLETDYLRASLRSDLAWITGVLDELHSGTLTWDFETLRAISAAIEGPHSEKGTPR